MTDVTYLQNPAVFPALDKALFEAPSVARLTTHERSWHKPRFLMLYGSVRERSYSRLLTFEAARLLEAMGGEVRVFNPSGLPLPDDTPDTHPKVKELRELVQCTFMRLARRLAKQYAWWGWAAPNTVTTRANAVPAPASISSGSVASQRASMWIIAATREADRLLPRHWLSGVIRDCIQGMWNTSRCSAG